MSTLQHALYQGLIRTLSPIGLALGRKQDPARWRERLAHYPNNLPPAPIWLHAASVGEAKAATLLMTALRAAGEHGPFIVTTTTRTGGDAIRAALGEQDRQLYAPIDTPGAVQKALDQIAPRALVVLEVEIWPNLWRACQQRGVPIVLANARLSESSLKRYLGKLPAVWQDTLGRASLVLAQTQSIAARYQQLGVQPQQLRVIDNLKYSLKLDPLVIERGKQLRQLLGSNRRIWLAASTHPGEEPIALACHRQLLAQQPDLLLVLVPRHPQRFDEVATACLQSGLVTQRRSTATDQPVRADTQVYLADTLGELLALFAAADLCWVAGSFVDVGGHNILEPAACGCPMVVGPDMRNFDSICAQFKASQALLQVQTPGQLEDALAQLLNDPSARQQLTDQAARQLQRYTEAANQQAAAIQTLLAAH